MHDAERPTVGVALLVRVMQAGGDADGDRQRVLDGNRASIEAERARWMIAMNGCGTSGRSGRSGCTMQSRSRQYVS